MANSLSGSAPSARVASSNWDAYTAMVRMWRDRSGSGRCWLRRKSVMRFHGFLTEAHVSFKCASRTGLEQNPDNGSSRAACRILVIASKANPALGSFSFRTKPGVALSNLGQQTTSSHLARTKRRCNSCRSTAMPGREFSVDIRLRRVSAKEKGKRYGDQT